MLNSAVVELYDGAEFLLETPTYLLTCIKLGQNPDVSVEAHRQLINKLMYSRWLCNKINCSVLIMNLVLVQGQIYAYIHDMYSCTCK